MIIFSPCLGCVFWAEDKIWTLMQHNNTELTHVQGANPEKPYSMTLDYGGSLEQLEAVRPWMSSWSQWLREAKV